MLIKIWNCNNQGIFKILSWGLYLFRGNRCIFSLFYTEMEISFKQKMVRTWCSWFFNFWPSGCFEIFSSDYVSIFISELFYWRKSPTTNTCFSQVCGRCMCSIFGWGREQIPRYSFSLFMRKKYSSCWLDWRSKWRFFFYEVRSLFGNQQTAEWRMSICIRGKSLSSNH